MMGYFDKQRKKIDAEKRLKELMNTQEYRKMQKKLRDESIADAETSLSIVSCEYLLKHNYKSRGFRNFLSFAASRFKYSFDEKQQYLTETNDRWIAEHGIDVLEFVGHAIKTDEKNRTCKCGKVIHVETYNFCPYCGEKLEGVENDAKN